MVTSYALASAAVWARSAPSRACTQHRLAEHMAPHRTVRGLRGVKATHIKVSTWHTAQAGNKAAQKRMQPKVAERGAAALL